MGAAQKSEKFPVQILSLDAIKVDHALQSRVKTSLEYQREFSEAMLRGDVFPPVVVFWDGKVYWLADGFHRVGAAKQAAKVNPKLRGIRAEVREGSKRDAAVFSAGANIKFSIPRTRDDIRKAIEMLLDDPQWSLKTDTAIAEHCGTGRAMVHRCRIDFCESRGLPRPEVVIDGRGSMQPWDRGRKDFPPIIKRLDGGSTKFRMSYKGRLWYLGTDPTSAEQKRAEILGYTAASLPERSHSEMSRDEVIIEARRMGDSSPGNGWRRLLWRMADLLEGRDSVSNPNAATRDVLRAAEAGEGITRHASVDELFEDLIDPPAAE